MYWFSESYAVQCKKYYLLTFYTRGKRGKQRFGILPQVTPQSGGQWIQTQSASSTHVLNYIREPGIWSRICVGPAEKSANLEKVLLALLIYKKKQLLAFSLKKLYLKDRKNHFWHSHTVSNAMTKSRLGFTAARICRLVRVAFLWKKDNSGFKENTGV